MSIVKMAFDAAESKETYGEAHMAASALVGPAMGDVIAKATAPARQHRRVEATKAALAELGENAFLWAISDLVARNYRATPFAKLGKGRWWASDGAAWKAALLEAVNFGNFIKISPSEDGESIQFGEYTVLASDWKRISESETIEGGVVKDVVAKMKRSLVSWVKASGWEGGNYYQRLMQNDVDVGQCSWYGVEWVAVRLARFIGIVEGVEDPNQPQLTQGVDEFVDIVEEEDWEEDL